MFTSCRERLKKAIKAKDSYSLVMEKVKHNNALKKQHSMDAVSENNSLRGKHMIDLHLPSLNKC